MKATLGRRLAAIALLANSIATGCGLAVLAGIRPQDAPGFILAQLVGAAAATLAMRWLAGAREKPG